MTWKQNKLIMDLSNHAVHEALLDLSPSVLIQLCSSHPGSLVPSPISSQVLSFFFHKCVDLLMRTMDVFVGLVKGGLEKFWRRTHKGTVWAIHKTLRIHATEADAQWGTLSLEARLDPSRKPQ